MKEVHSKCVKIFDWLMYFLEGKFDSNMSTIQKIQKLGRKDIFQLRKEIGCISRLICVYNLLVFVPVQKPKAKHSLFVSNLMQYIGFSLI